MRPLFTTVIAVIGHSYHTVQDCHDWPCTMWSPWPITNITVVCKASWTNGTVYICTCDLCDCPQWSNGAKTNWWLFVSGATDLTAAYPLGCEWATVLERLPGTSYQNLTCPTGLFIYRWLNNSFWAKVFECMVSFTV